MAKQRCHIYAVKLNVTKRVSDSMVRESRRKFTLDELEHIMIRAWDKLITCEESRITYWKEALYIIYDELDSKRG